MMPYNVFMVSTESQPACFFNHIIIMFFILISGCCYLLYRGSKNFNLFNGGSPHSTKGFSSGSFIRLNRKVSFSIKRDSTTRSVLLSGQGDSLSHSNGAIVNDLSSGIQTQADALAFGTLVADIIPTPSGFPAEVDEFDLDQPTEGFSSIPDAIEDIRQGKVGFKEFDLFVNFIIIFFLLCSFIIWIHPADGTGCG